MQNADGISGSSPNISGVPPRGDTASWRKAAKLANQATVFQATSQSPASNTLPLPDQGGVRQPATPTDAAHLQPTGTPALSTQARSYSTGDLKRDLQEGEHTTKAVNDNITNVETHFPQLVQDLNVYCLRSAKLRDAGDLLSKSLQGFAGSEQDELKRGLQAFSECFAVVQDHRNCLVSRLENKVVPAFGVYETRCKQAKVDLKQHSIAHSKELNEHKMFEKVKLKTAQQFELSKAEEKYKKASDEATRSAKILNDQHSEFERQKVLDLKKVFGDFMLSEMVFYAKAMEMFTRGYQELMAVDEDEDVGQLQESMRFQPHQLSSPGNKLDMYGGSAPALMTQQPVARSPAMMGGMAQQQQRANPDLERTF